MQPKKLSDHIGEIVSELRIPDLIRFLIDLPAKDSEITDSDSSGFRTSIFVSYDGFVRCMMDQEKRHIIQALKLNEVYQHENISKMVAIIEGSKGITASSVFKANAELFESFKMSLKFLESYANTFRIFLTDSRYPSPEKEQRVLDFELITPDDENHERKNIPISVLISTLRNLEKLYSTIATLHDSPGSLSIGFIESGTEIKISIVGGAKVVKQINQLIVQIWRLFRHREFDDFDRKVDSSLKGIDFIVDIRKKIKSGELTEDEVNKVIQAVWGSSSEIIKAGCLPSEEFEAGGNLTTKQMLSEKMQIRQIAPPVVESKKAKKNPNVKK